MKMETLTALAEKKIDLSDGIIGSFRRHELVLFREKGMREVTQDSYKFTNLETFFENLSYGPQTFDGELPASLASFPTITLTDGEVTKAENLPQGISLRKLPAHLKEIKDLFREENALSHLHHALTHEGVILEVDKNTEVSVPVRILSVHTKACVSAPTHVIIAHPFSKVTVIEEAISVDGASHAFIPETYIMGHPSSKVEHICLDRENETGLHHGSVFAEVERDASVRSFFFNTSGHLVRKNLTLNLNAPGANGETYSLFLTNKTEHSDIYTVINHKAPDTTSDQIAKGILDGDSKGIFTGKIHIHPKAQRVASGQLNKNLLLSRKAQVHSQPQLEIFADDVKCSHGSTTGQLSEDEVFYFQARGIPAEKARNLLALGFGFEIVQKIENKAARDHVMHLIRVKLAEKFSLGGL